jgi:hypothetical protein
VAHHYAADVSDCVEWANWKNADSYAGLTRARALPFLRVGRTNEWLSG